jgi:hypothetical protein
MLRDANGDILLEPGDIVKMQYEIGKANAQQVALAVHGIKATLSADKRFNYQGSEILSQTDTYNDMGYESSRTYQVLNVYIQVAKKVKEYSRPQTAETGTGVRTTESNGVKQAGVPAGRVVVALLTLTGLLAGATVSVSHYLSIRQKAMMVNGVLVSDLTPEQKVKVVGDIMGDKTSVGAGVAAVGGSIMTAVLILGGIWAASQILGGRSQSSSGGGQDQ